MDYEQLTAEVVARARKAGADEADAMLRLCSRFEVLVKGREIETLDASDMRRVCLRVFVGERLGVASTTNCDTSALDRLVETAIALADVAEKRPENRLPETFEFVARPELKVYDPATLSLSVEQKIALAKRCEFAATAADPRIVSRQETRFATETNQLFLANSFGFHGSYHSSHCLLSSTASAIAAGAQYAGNETSVSHGPDDLEDPEEIGRRAAHRAVRKLGPRRVPEQRATIVFERRAAAQIWLAVAEALNGRAASDGMSSFLPTDLGSRIASSSVTLIDDGALVRGVGSAPFDGEGVPTSHTVLIQNGVLRSLLTDASAARKLGIGTTGNALRSERGDISPGPSNLYLVAGNETPEEIIKGVARGLFVTDLRIPIIDSRSGKFTFHADGLWIENGEITYPVRDVTLAGSLRDLLQSIERVGTDLLFAANVVSPTFQVAPMTIIGN